MKPDPIYIDLDKYPSDPVSDPPPNEAGEEVEPNHSLGFVLTPMNSRKSQIRPDDEEKRGYTPRLYGGLLCRSLVALYAPDLRWQAENDKFYVGGQAVARGDETIDLPTSLSTSPSVNTVLHTYYFTEYPDFRVIIDVESHSTTPADAWIQFFFNERLVQELFIGGERKVYSQEFRFRGTILPHQGYSIVTRLASEHNAGETGYFLFNRSQVRIYEPQVADKE